MDWMKRWRRGASPAATAREEKSGAAPAYMALHGLSGPRWSRRDYAALAREGYMTNPVVFRCVRLLSEAAASVPLLAYDGTAEVIEHPLLDLMARPNPRQAGGAFLEALYGHLLIAGNAFVELVDGGEGARELHLLRPDRVGVATDERGWPAALEVRAGSAVRRVPFGSVDGGGAAQLSLFNPLDDHLGYPPLAAALIALDTHNAAGRWNKALLDNSARPSGALVYQPKEGGNLSDEQFERLRAELDDGFSGAVRAGRPLLLEGGLAWQQMAMSPKDMDFIEAKHSAARDIALALGVPPIRIRLRRISTATSRPSAIAGALRAAMAWCWVSPITTGR